MNTTKVQVQVKYKLFIIFLLLLSAKLGLLNLQVNKTKVETVKEKKINNNN